MTHPFTQIVITEDDRDDPEFVAAVRQAVSGVIHASNPPDIFIVKIDKWFGQKWLAFSHKILGALGVAQSDLRIPPFVPSRVLKQDYLVRDVVNSDYSLSLAPLELHINQVSSANSRRKVSDLCPTAALFWWTGATLDTGRGALMAYVPAPAGHASWYAELTRHTGWRSGTMKHITRAELERYQSLAP